MPFFVTEQIGEKRSRTPDGFLICHDVALARTGEQLYRSDEVPVRPKPGTDYVRIMRDAEEVFRNEALLSAEGKPFVINHPDSMAVTPANYRGLTRGHVQNVRRGTGVDADVILGDIVVLDQEAIDLIEAGMREVSMGYDCGYQELGEEADLPSGIGRQHNIIFNHVALVDAGRCGPRCAIGDHSHCNTGDSAMATRTSLIDRIMTSMNLKTGDRQALEKVIAEHPLSEGENGSVIINNHLPTGDSARATADEAPPWFKEHEKKTEDRFKGLDAAIKKIADAKSKDDDDDDETPEEKEKRLKKEKAEKENAGDEAILGQLEMEAPPGSGDAIRKANDSVLLEDGFARLVADAEVLAPGLRVPTFDTKAKPRATFDAMCNLRRSALGFGLNEAATAGMIETANGGRTIDTKAADCGTIRTIFNAAVALKKAANNADSTRQHRAGDSRTTSASPIKSIADLQRVLDKKNGRIKETA